MPINTRADLEKESPFEKGIFTSQIEENIIDLGLLDPSGCQVGASGSDKLEIKISEVNQLRVTAPAGSNQANGE